MSKCPYVKLHTLPWGTQFTIRGNAAIFTLERGNGMYPWVSWYECEPVQVNGHDTETPTGRLILKKGSMHIGQEVKRVN